MTKKPLQSNGQQFVNSFLGAFAFIVLGLLGIAAIAYSAGLDLSDFIDRLNTSFNHS